MHQTRAMDNSQVVMPYCRPNCHPLALLLYGSVHFEHNSIYINNKINNIYRVLSYVDTFLLACLGSSIFLKSVDYLTEISTNHILQGLAGVHHVRTKGITNGHAGLFWWRTSPPTAQTT